MSAALDSILDEPAALRGVGDRYLGLLRRSAEISPPRTAAEFRARIEWELGRDFELEAVGNFAYARSR